MRVAATAPGSPLDPEGSAAQAARRQRRVVDPLEDTLLAGMAGVRSTAAPARVVEWEGRRYRVSAPRAEALRLRRVRQRQGGASLQPALDRAQQSAEDRRRSRARRHADVRSSMRRISAIRAGPALAGGNVALRHDLGATGIVGPRGRVAAAGRRALEQGLAGHGLAARARRRARAPVAAAARRERSCRRSRDSSRPSGRPRR